MNENPNPAPRVATTPAEAILALITPDMPGREAWRLRHLADKAERKTVFGIRTAPSTRNARRLAAKSRTRWVNCAPNGTVRHTTPNWTDSDVLQAERTKRQARNVAKASRRARARA